MIPVYPKQNIDTFVSVIGSFISIWYGEDKRKKCQNVLVSTETYQQCSVKERDQRISHGSRNTDMMAY